MLRPDRPPRDGLPAIAEPRKQIKNACSGMWVQKVIGSGSSRG